MEGGLQIQALPDDGDENVHGHRHPDLRLHGVLGRAVELLDAQVLLDPLEEQLDLPAGLVQFANGHRRRTEQVGQEHEGLLRVRVLEADAAQMARIALAAVVARHGHRLVADDSLRPVVRRGVDPAQVGVQLGAGDEERAGLLEREQPLEVEVGPVHHLDRRRLRDQQVERVDVVQLAVGNVDEAENAAAQVQQRVHLHGGLGAAERRQGEQRQAQVDGGRVQRVHCVRQLQAQILPGVQLARLGDQPLRELRVNAPIPAFAGVGQRRPPHGCADAHVRIPASENSI